ncbi:MAG TPA: UDP-N-acetylmuramoyl-L-alanine--D-glutamate ligase [Candidatus Bathyarchaeia archaeon]|nr:UDP-N-acetylmuramoyl-L-alanine--D-glutamate ligase [Candidatus Bathyarchaeia archaeon]
MKKREKLLLFLKDKKILILGFGSEGQAAYTYLRQNFPQKIIGVADRLTTKKFGEKQQNILKSDKQLKIHLGRKYLGDLNKYDLIIKSPGVPSHLPQIKTFIKRGGKITSQTELLLEYCPGEIVGVTGTKGKTTTASLIYEILRTKFRDVRLVGNIGHTSLSFVNRARKNTIFVFEFSSHQLVSLKVSPHVAVFLNIFPEHLDYYSNFRKYLRAKENITLHQKTNDYFIYNRAFPDIRRIASKTRANNIPFSLEARKGSICFIKDNYLLYRKERIIKTTEVPLLGRFNLQNVMPAVIVAKLYHIPNREIVKTIGNFHPVKHRLEKVGTFNEIIFYNDSIATIPQATIAALEALGNQVETLILGGYERHLNYHQLATKILETKLKNLILFPTTGKEIWRNIKLEIGDRKSNLPNHLFTKEMEKAVVWAYRYTSPGKICLLSPAAASFNLFRDYQERGNLFKKYVKKIGQASSDNRQP